MIGYPDWWAGGFPDAEDLMKTLFTPLLTNVSLVPWLPEVSKVATQLQAGNGFLRIYRTGGKINHEQNRDEPNVQFAALTESRAKSWELIEFIRMVLDEFVARGALVPGTSQVLQCAGEAVGPQLIPELLRDEKLVPVTFTLHTWKPKGLHYRQALGL